MNIHLIVAGQLELPVGRKLIGHCGHSAGMDYPLRGCGNIRRKAYKYAPLVMGGDGVLVLTDFMDSGCACVPQALIEYRAESVRHRAFLYRFAVPELESVTLPREMGDMSDYGDTLEAVDPAVLGMFEDLGGEET